MKEDYVSFEVAKLLKEKGFNEYCLKNYWSSDKELHDWKWELSYNRNSDGNCNTKDCAAPTLQMAMKWLREVHHYYIQVMLDSWACGGHTGYYVVIQKTDSNFEIMLQDAIDEVFYQTYEKACEAACIYSLENLI